MRDGRAVRDSSVQSVHRAISILQVLALHGTAGVTEIAAELGVHKSTVFRLLATLESRGLVGQHTERGRYRLGYGVVQLAEGAVKMDDLSSLSRPVCRQLAETVRETVNLVVRDGKAVVSIAQVLGAPRITTVNCHSYRPRSKSSMDCPSPASTPARLHRVRESGNQGNPAIRFRQSRSLSGCGQAQK